VEVICGGLQGGMVAGSGEGAGSSSSSSLFWHHALDELGYDAFGFGDFGDFEARGEKKLAMRERILATIRLSRRWGTQI
jgi:hypothetical protein